MNKIIGLIGLIAYGAFATILLIKDFWIMFLIYWLADEYVLQVPIFFMKLIENSEDSELKIPKIRFKWK